MKTLRFKLIMTIFRREKENRYNTLLQADNQL